MTDNNASGGTPPRQRRHRGFSCLMVAAVFAVPLIPLGSRVLHVRQQHLVIQQIRDMGGTVDAQLAFLPAQLTSARVGTVNLSGQHIDRATFRSLAELPVIASLQLDRATIDADAWPELANIAGVRNLFLTNVTLRDEDLAHLAAMPSLRMLSLRGSSVTDQGLANLAAMGPLQTLDLMGTDVTEAGLQQLTSLAVVNTLMIDSPCVTKGNVMQLRAVTGLQYLRLYVADGSGRDAWDAAQAVLGIRVEALSSVEGGQLWMSTTAWENTAAGVLEAVLAETDLDDAPLRKLRKFVGAYTREWNREMTSTPITPAPVTVLTREQFLAAARGDSRHSFFDLLLFAHSQAVPEATDELLATLDDRRGLEKYGESHQVAVVAALARNSLADPRVAQILDELLDDQSLFVRTQVANIFCHRGHYASVVELPPPSAAMAEFAVPRLIELLGDEDQGLRNIAARGLGELAAQHPSSADLAVPPLLELRSNNPHGMYIESALKQIAAANKQAVAPVFPRAMELLASTHEERQRHGLQVLGAIAAVDERVPPWAFEQFGHLMAMEDPSTQSLSSIAVCAVEDPQYTEPVLIRLLDSLGRPSEVSRESTVLELVLKRVRDRHWPDK